MKNGQKWMNFIHVDECHVINENGMVINKFHPLCMKKMIADEFHTCG